MLKAMGFRFAASSALQAETIAIREALRGAAGWTRIWLESDYAPVVQAIAASSSSNVPWHIAPVISDIRALRARFDCIFIEHCVRETNAAADWVAGLVRFRGDFFLFDSDVPWQLRDIIRNDVTFASAT